MNSVLELQFGILFGDFWYIKTSYSVYYFRLIKKIQIIMYID